MDPITIKVRKDGPLVVLGPIRLIDHEGNEIAIPQTEKQNVVLCRCGRSRNRPFCDGAHRQNEDKQHSVSPPCEPSAGCTGE